MESFATLAPRFYTSAPVAQSRQATNPTLLVSWWATGFSLAIILVRVIGRYIRTERLFAEDWLMALAIIPLLVRMGFAHMVLLWGTNNADVTGLTAMEISHREIGSRMVLGARIFYALFIWTAKFSVTAFFKRLTAQIWRRSYHHVIIFIRVFLIMTFLAVVIATLAECHPINHYWQVVPDPGSKCRQGYAQLITMGACDVITDLLLVAFPIPIIYLSAMPTKRKISLVLLFGLSLILVAITCYRIPSVISRHGSQQYRSLMASLEILAATAVSNAIVIGSFVRDRGVKKQKFKAGSVSDSVDHNSLRRVTMTHHHWGSDADLVGDLGIRLDPELQSPSYQKIRPAPMALPSTAMAKRGSIDPNWQFTYSQANGDDDRTSTTDSLGGLKVHPHEYIETSSIPSPTSTTMPPPAYMSLSKVSLNDVGGLLDPPSPTDLTRPQHHHHHPRPPPVPSDQPFSTRSRTLLNAVSGLLSSSPTNPGSSRSSLHNVPVSHVRNFSRPTSATPPHRSHEGPTSAATSTSGRQNRQGRTTSSRPPAPVPKLQDLGGLLNKTDDDDRKPRGG